MCGVTGFLTKNELFSKQDLENMTSVLKHRGPDAAGYYYNSNIGLGHRRLSILDLSDHANQPIYSADKQYSIIFNGEIYNFKELSAKYNLDLKTTSDTEVVLELYIKLGSEMVQELNGMFVISIWNNTTKELVVFRDRLGIKPLFFYLNDGVFAFSSELKSLQSLLKDKIKLKLDQTAINEYLHLGYIPQPLTIFEGISKFPSGSFAKISLKEFELEITRFWSAKDKLSASTGLIEEASAKAKLNELIRSSVNYRMISDVPLGTFLSGGTDSSLVTAVAQDLSGSKIQTFSIGFKEAKYNEAEHAKKVAAHLKTDHHEFILSEQDAMEEVSKMIDLYDEPFADSSAIPTLLVSKMAKKHVTVTLSGDGGDEQFLGYNMYTWAQKLNNPIVKLLKKPISSVLKKGDNRKKRAALMFEYPSQKRIQTHIFSQEQYLFSEKEINAICKTNYQSTTTDVLTNLNRKLSPSEKQAFYDLNYYLRDDLLVKVDRASMYHSLETRVPLLDHRIVEFSLNLPEKFKVKNGVQKHLLKEVLYEYIPKSIMERPKWGFSIPLIKWLKKDLAFLIEEYLSDDMVEKFNVVDGLYVKQLIQKFKNGEDFLYNRIWNLIVLHMFLKNIDA